MIGRDLALRTGLAQVFMLAATWTALQISIDAGAAHQALRQLWMFLAFLLDAFAVTAQSLIGYFLGADRRSIVRLVARVRVAGRWAQAVVCCCSSLIIPWRHFSFHRALIPSS